MKHLAALTLIVMLALSLAACATSTGGETMRVKCPSCGFEFDVPDSIGG